MSLSGELARCLRRLFGVRIVREDQFANVKWFHTSPNYALAVERISSLGQLLRPQRVHGVQKVRLGGPHDGGYVCLDDFSDIEAAISLGTGENASWDAVAAERGLIVHQYDHTVAESPIAHANFRFHRRKIGAAIDHQTETIASVLAQTRLTRPNSTIMKIDIEGDEWAALAAAPVAALDTVAQIICEFHGFQQIIDDDWFERAFAVLSKLNDKFSVVHVHGNNHDLLMAIGNFLFPGALEVTYASRAKYTFSDSDEVFPGKLVPTFLRR